MVHEGLKILLISYPKNILLSNKNSTQLQQNPENCQIDAEHSDLRSLVYFDVGFPFTGHSLRTLCLAIDSCRESSQAEYSGSTDSWWQAGVMLDPA